MREALISLSIVVVRNVIDVHCMSILMREGFSASVSEWAKRLCTNRLSIQTPRWTQRWGEWLWILQTQGRICRGCTSWLSGDLIL